MPTVDIRLTSSAEPDKVRGALLDFTENRPQIWPGIEPSEYAVFELGEDWAEIREGSKAPGGNVWARERYEWSDPDTVRWTVVESNFCSPGSSVSATITPADGGGSVIDLTWNRHPTTLSGRIATLLIVATRGMPVAASFKKGLAIIEKQA